MSRISDSLMAAELSAHRDNLPHTCALTDFAAASVAHSTSPSSTHHHHYHHHQQPQPLPEPDMRLFIDRLFTEYASDQTKGLNLFEFTEAVRAHPGLLSYTYDLGAEAEKVEGLYSVKYLVAVDGGEHSLRAFEHIARTARREDFVYVVYVNPRLDPARKPPYMKKEAYIQAHETRTHEMREFLDRCQNLSARNSVAPCQSIFSEGDAIPVISQLLDKYDIDILAMGSHGYGDEMVKSQR
jgi:nucleotide-binding universal stress UspA family protein